MFYTDKIESLEDIFGTTAICLETNCIIVNGRVYPIVEDVIILLDPAQYPPALRNRIEGHNQKTAPMFGSSTHTPAKAGDISLRISPAGENKNSASDLPVGLHFAEDIQFTFGEEWQRFPEILPEHKNEFSQYFDLVDISHLKDSRVCDLGCGIGRWSYFLKNRCRELVLVDFSEAIFVARRNLKETSRALFFMGDLKRLPFRDCFADFLFCLGVLHHLPTNALEEVRRLKRYAPTSLVYLYYALDNRPFYFKIFLSLITFIRLAVSRIRNELFRCAFTNFVAIFIYLPLVNLGQMFSIANFSQLIPLYEGYKDKTLSRIRQDVYDRFFTRIEQRFSRKEIMTLKDTFESITVSEFLPYWHFLCKEKGGLKDEAGDKN